MKNKNNILIFSSNPHPLITQEFNELQKHFSKVIYLDILDRKNLFKNFSKNKTIFLFNLKEVISFLGIIIKNFKIFPIQKLILFYLNLLNILILDKKQNFDIIHAHWLYPAGMIAEYYSRHKQKKIIITVHGYDADERTLNDSKLKKLIKKIGLKTNKIITAEKRLYKNLQTIGLNNLFLTNQFVELPNHNYDINLIKNELNISQKSFVIGFGPHLKKMYGLDDFIKAILMIKKDIPNLFVLCIGEGEMRNYVIQIFKKENLRYKITGKINHSEVIKHLMTCDIVCNPGYITQGIFALEAFSCGKPVIGYEDIAEVKIENNVTGLLAKSGNIDEFADLLLKLYHNPDLRQELGIKARKLTIKNFTKEKRLEDILKIYEE